MRLQKKTEQDNLPGFSLEGDQMTLKGRKSSQTVPVRELSKDMIDWINSGRKSMYNQLRGDSQNVTFFSSHLPVVTTFNQDSPFPFNCGNKGVGFIPKMEHLDDCIKMYQDVFDQTRGIFWKDSLKARLEVVSEFNFNPDLIDYRCLSTLEIFEKKTFANLRDTPMASLLYTGVFPTYNSYQVNCGVEVIGQDDPRHTFVMLSRVMFEYDSFHIMQPQFPYAYIFWVSEIQNKTPTRVEEQPDKVQYLRHTQELVWDPKAIDAVNQAPGMIRQFIREQIEKYARERGFTQINLELVMEAKKALRR